MAWDADTFEQIADMFSILAVPEFSAESYVQERTARDGGGYDCPNLYRDIRVRERTERVRELERRKRKTPAEKARRLEYQKRKRAELALASGREPGRRGRPKKEAA